MRGSETGGASTITNSAPSTTAELQTSGDDADYCVALRDASAWPYIVSFDVGTNFGEPMVLSSRRDQDRTVSALMEARQLAPSTALEEAIGLIQSAADAPTRAYIDTNRQRLRAASQFIVSDHLERCNDETMASDEPAPLLIPDVGTGVTGLTYGAPDDLVTWARNGGAVALLANDAAQERISNGISRIRITGDASDPQLIRGCKDQLAAAATLERLWTFEETLSADFVDVPAALKRWANTCLLYAEAGDEDGLDAWSRSAATAEVGRAYTDFRTMVIRAAFDTVCSEWLAVADTPLGTEMSEFLQPCSD